MSTTAEPGIAAYPHVFEPLRLGPVELRNRIYMPPHGQPFWVTVPGTSQKMPAAEAAFYYRERAAGGAALIFCTTGARPAIGYSHGSPWEPAAIDSFARVAEAVHGEGARMMAELIFGGESVGLWEPIGPIAPVIGPSDLQSFNSPTVRRALKTGEIRQLIESYAVATRNLRKAEWDGVEVHASHGVLVEQFLSPFWNHREDEYGGDLAGRCRFLVEALEAVRSEIGPQMAVGMRITADELMPGGVDAAGTRAILEHLGPTGLLDFVDLDVAVEPEQPQLMTTTFFEPKFHNLPNVLAVSSAAKPTMKLLATPGRVTSIAEAEELLGQGVLDMIGIGRGHIAEPELVRNALEGREAHSRTCIAANHCIESRAMGLGCAINPATGREERWGRRAAAPASKSQRVHVIGGGPGGCEAARVAALRGHAVTLWERGRQLGGAMELWARLPGREHLRTLPDWYRRALETLSVDVRLESEVTPEQIKNGEPDAVIAATGSRFSRTGESGFRRMPVPGFDQPHVFTPEDVLEERVSLSGRVLVLDEEGRHAAAGIAEIAARNGAEVDYVTRFPLAVRALWSNSAATYVIAAMRAAGVRIHTQTYLREIRPSEVTLYDVGTDLTTELEVDAVVLATMRIPETKLADSLEGQVPYVYVIGDAASPRSLLEATYEGQRFARIIGEPDMPSSVISDMLAAVARPLRAASSL